MKKLILALMCISMSLTMSAQQKKNREARPNQSAPCAMGPRQCHCGMAQKPGMKMNKPGKGMNDMVVNMKAIKSLGLDSTTVNAVRDLKKQKADEMRAIRQAMRPQKTDVNAPTADKNMKADKKDKKADKKKLKKGEKNIEKKNEAVSPDEKKAQREQFRAKMQENREKMQACTKSYRAELRKILGDEKYIEYLEKLTQQPKMQKNNNKPQPRHNRGGRM